MRAPKLTSNIYLFRSYTYDPFPPRTWSHTTERIHDRGPGYLLRSCALFACCLERLVLFSSLRALFVGHHQVQCDDVEISKRVEAGIETLVAAQSKAKKESIEVRQERLQVCISRRFLSPCLLCLPREGRSQLLRTQGYEYLVGQVDTRCVLGAVAHHPDDASVE
jgi:hypothetical protein